MLTADQLRDLEGRAVLGLDGARLGVITALYADAVDGDPTFATVSTGDAEAFVPLAEAELRDGDVVVPYDAVLVRAAPAVRADEQLSVDEEDRIYDHYGLTEVVPKGGPAAAGTDGAMTRSEERLQVSTQRVETGRARLRKQVVTELETVQVPVRKERLVLETEPVDGGSGPVPGGPAAGEVVEVVLHEERPVIRTETVPVERVRLATEQVVEEVEVTEQVRKERIEVDGVDPV